METKVLQFDKSVDRYIKFSKEKSAQEDFVGALNFLFSAKSIEPDNTLVLALIADVYADMNLFELSNQYWFEYIDKSAKEKHAVAFEELAINYFYLDNFWASSYYFHKKLDIDGYISKEGLSQEIIDFFSGEELKKTAYRIVYPFERANYDYEIKRAKHAITLGLFEEGIKYLSRIPQQRLDEENAGNLAMCYFITDQYDKAEEVCRLSIKNHGPNITAYSHLSTIYGMKEDVDNSDFYYQKALSLRKGEQGEAYKIATCAFEREDHQNVLTSLEEIIKERPFEYTMRFFYGLALANVRNYQGATEQLKQVVLIEPNDMVIKFYLEYIEKLAVDGNDFLNLLPFNYVKEIPEQVTKEWRKKIKFLVKNPDKISSALKKAEAKEMVKWGLTESDGDIMRDCAYILSNSTLQSSKDLVLSTLLSPFGTEEMKHVLIYVAIISGIKQKFGVVVNECYIKIRPKKLLCEKDKKYGYLYFSSYALCLSKLAFYDIDGIDKVAKVCDRIYKKFQGNITSAEVSNEEIAGLILSQCGFKKYSENSSVTSIFSITEEKLNLLKNMLKD